MYYFEDIIDEIEKNLAGDIDINALSKKANMSVYEFRRIFSFITKIPFSEYVRKRKLSLAALELYKEKKTVSDIALKYGYDSPSSFSRAFKEFHKISPLEVINGNGNFNLLTRLNTEITTTGGENLSYTIFEKDEFVVSGFYGKSELSDTECCDNVWNVFLESDIYNEISKNNDKIFAVYSNNAAFVDCIFGTLKSGENNIRIPKSEWVSFRIRGTEDEYVNKFYKNILNQWFSSVGYEKNNDIPNIEVFPADMSEENFEWEIWIPIK